MTELEGRLTTTAVGLLETAAAARWRGPDIYDALWWPHWPGPLVGGRRRRQAVIQLHARSPVDVRRLYRRAHPVIPKALGVFGSVGLRAHALTGAEAPRALAEDALGVLDADRSAGERAWGYPYDMQTRWSFYPAGAANVVATTYAASGLLESGREEWVSRGREAARWVLEELWVEPEGYFGYHPERPVNIHNANLLGAWLVHAALGDDPLARERVARAVDRTLAHQNADGSWPYGEGAGLEWADSFHTGFVITCLDRMRGVDVRVGEAVARSASQYRAFFDDAGRAKLWAQKEYPEDAHSAGTGMTTLALLLRDDLVERELLERVCRRVLDTGLRDGHAIYRRFRRHRTTVRYMRWCDAHIALGMVDAAGALAGRDDPAPAAGVVADAS